MSSEWYRGMLFGVGGAEGSGLHLQPDRVHIFFCTENPLGLFGQYFKRHSIRGMVKSS